ncbi:MULTISPECIES: sulfur carrier protein ThiS [Cobetia]|uniref:Sulfur carrier protein ThiS n=1 Tax=Cobetia crustatorum TaxID=553385 RepID=A0A558HSA6_9GAMM|nr:MULTISPECIES: sulfur carrier protein ThiS [Cobetia]TVU72025.1 sulfur carrier protein ThiS [Cobetia crustatorum]
MQIQLNGEDHVVADTTTIAALVESLGLEGRRLAVECNDDIVPRSEHAGTRLHDGDRIEIVHAIGGG